MEDDLIREFLQASSFIAAMESTFALQVDQLKALGLTDAESMMMEYIQEHKEQFISEAIKAVKSVYSVTELRQLTEFYRTPLGKMMTSKMPALASSINGLMYSWVEKAQEEVDVRLFEKEIAPH